MEGGATFGTRKLIGLLISYLNSDRDGRRTTNAEYPATSPHKTQHNGATNFQTRIIHNIKA